MRISLSDKRSLKAISALVNSYFSNAPIAKASRSWSSMLVVDIGDPPINRKKKAPIDHWSLIVEWGKWRLQDRNGMIATSQSTEKKIDIAIATLVGRQTESLTFHANGRLNLKLAGGLSLNVRPSGAASNAVISEWFVINGRGWSLAFNPNRRFIVEVTDPGVARRSSRRARPSAAGRSR